MTKMKPNKPKSLAERWKNDPLEIVPLSKKEGRWTKKCKHVYPRFDLLTETIRLMQCDNYIPDEYEVCDFCMIHKYKLFGKAEYDSQDYKGIGPRLYTEEQVIKALRLAEGK